MGLEDRDWYREATAEKNGMRYNKRNATYSVANDVLNSSVRNSQVQQYNRFRAVEQMRHRNKQRWGLVILVCCSAVSLTVAALLFMRGVNF